MSAAKPTPDFYVYEWDNERGVSRDLSPFREDGVFPSRTIPVYKNHEEQMIDAAEKIAWLVLHLTHHHNCLHTSHELTGIRKWLESRP